MEVLSGRRCTLCGSRPFGRVEVSLRGELTCARHAVLGRCVFCARPHDEPDPDGWTPFTGPQLRCPTCARDAVDTQVHARRLLPGIRADMAGIGIELPTRVLVRLTEPADLDPGHQPVAGAVLLGVTEHVSVVGELGGGHVVEIRIARGQPALQFGRAVSHEMGHAWLTQHGTRRPDSVVEEGLCELFANAWLKRSADPHAGALRARLQNNPDPVYGGGFRLVAEAVRRHGVGTVLTSLAACGALPGSPSVSP